MVIMSYSEDLKNRYIFCQTGPHARGNQN